MTIAKQFFFLLCVLILCNACQEVPYNPKPRAYPKVEYPERSYQKFDEGYCSFTFDYPVYTKVLQDTTFFDEKPSHPCWFDIYYPEFDSKIHCSYYPVGVGKDFDDLKNDAFEFVDWHNKKANYIDEMRVQKEREQSVCF